MATPPLFFGGSIFDPDQHMVCLVPRRSATEAPVDRGMPGALASCYSDHYCIDSALFDLHLNIVAQYWSRVRNNCVLHRVLKRKIDGNI